jgi:RHS repeat-associated protein
VAVYETKGNHIDVEWMYCAYELTRKDGAEYTPYGELWIEKASAASNIDRAYRFTGKERDEETGLYYYGARYLDSKASRWARRLTTRRGSGTRACRDRAGCSMW